MHLDSLWTLHCLVDRDERLWLERYGNTEEGLQSRKFMLIFANDNLLVLADILRSPKYSSDMVP